MKYQFINNQSQMSSIVFAHPSPGPITLTDEQIHQRYARLIRRLVEYHNLNIDEIHIDQREITVSFLVSKGNSHWLVVQKGELYDFFRRAGTGESTQLTSLHTNVAFDNMADVATEIFQQPQVWD